MPRDPKGKPAEEEKEQHEEPELPMRYGWFGTLLIASGRLWKKHWKTAVPPFLAVAAVLSLAPFLIFAFRDSSTQRTVGTIIIYANILVVPLFGAWVTARLSVLLAHPDESKRTSYRGAGEITREVRPHIAAASMVATALAMLLGYALQPVGPLVVPFLFLGPPILIQAIAVEGESFTEGWARTKDLLIGEIARVVIYLASISLGLALLLVIGGQLVGAALAAGSMGVAVNVPIYIAATLILISLPLSFMACVTVVVYLELVDRKESVAA
jgi:hypothetical protein